ncbi:hypothetical protein Taro_052290 [Colocasia esculenta]|uniref:Uncharacterized protein n=1 Tax=Colocasia esculenta TaxID=4460 RepID=A0A843XI76_COLES|nr:hypothetical protein [Colocasia esculenta]
MSSVLDTLTPLFELYVRLRETRHALLVGGTDTSSRHWSPTSPFPVPHSGVLWPETLEEPGMGLRFRQKLGEFPTEPVTSEAHPYSPQAKVKRKFRYHLPVRGRVAAVLGKCLQQCSFFPQLY